MATAPHKWPKPVEPISPKDVLGLKEKVIPFEVIEAFNEMIASKFDGRQSRFVQKDVVKLILKKFDEYGNKDAGRVGNKRVFDNDWLDVEPLYEKRGWNVEYDKPGYNETYDAMFIFSTDFPEVQK